MMSTRRPRCACSKVVILGVAALAGVFALSLLLAIAFVDQASAATFTVNSTGDGSDAAPGNGVCQTATPGECTLRAAIQEANALAGADNIQFNIPGAGPQTVMPGSALPTLSDPVTIDGYSQPGASANTNPIELGSDALLMIELDGTAAGSANGLRITSGNSTVKGLVINRFANGGILITTSGGNTIEGNYIGTDVTGNVDLGSSANGVFINGPAGNMVGGMAAAARNVISGNNLRGVEILGSGASGNLVQGNYIGTGATGSTDVGNSDAGVLINGAPTNTVGGTAAGARNIISGNDGSGVLISGVGNLVQGNYIGTNATGSADLGNSADGVFILRASANTIGGTVAGARNVISGNDVRGVEVFDNGATANFVQGNYIGTDATGILDVGNSLDGVLILGAPGNTVGGTAAGARNVISGNNQQGVYISTNAASGNLVEGNYIGTDASGSVDLGNSGNGVIIDGAPGNTIGGTAAGARNVISGNNNRGVIISAGGATGNVVLGNYIGTDAGGSVRLGNSSNGVQIDGAPGNTIGGASVAERNVISGNNGPGILASNANSNGFRGNFIGTDASGIAPLGNSGAGIHLSASSSNAIGGTTAAGANTIAYNSGDGIFISSGTGSWIIINSIHSNEELGIDLSPNGVTPNDPGDADTGANNLQNFPILTSVSSSGGITTVNGTLNSMPNTNFRLDFYANAVCDPSQFGEGQTFMNAFGVTTDAAGNASFSIGMGSAPGQFITATASRTSAPVDTSEFSNCIAATPAGTPTPSSSPSPSPTPTPSPTPSPTRTPSPTPSAGKVTGGGQIAGDPLFSALGDLLSDPAVVLNAAGNDQATFGLVINNGGTPTGGLEYQDHGADTVIKATSLTALFLSASCGTDTHARFTGFATVNGVANQPFEVEVDDCNEPGTADTFGITTTGYTNGPKTLTAGNIQIH